MLTANKLGLIIIAVAIFFLSCKNDSYKTTDSGLKYRYIEEGEGPKPEPGQVMTMHMVYKGENDSVMFSSLEQGAPIPMPVDSAWKDDGSIYEAFKMLKKGDSMQVQLTAENFFQKTVRQPLPDTLEAKSMITFNIGVEDVMSMDDYRAYQMEQFQKQQEAAAERSKEQLKIDAEIIDKYLAENNMTAEKTESGLRYVILEEGKGPKADEGDVAKVDFTGKTLDGKVFYTSNENMAKESNVFREGDTYDPLEFTIGAGQMIKGVDEGVALLKEGAKAKFFLPSTLAYGERGAGPDIQPNQIIMFDVELVDVQKK